MSPFPLPIYPHGAIDREELPEDVRYNLELWADRNRIPAATVFQALRWDSLNKCYAFVWKRCFYGVERDGYIHT